MYLLWKTSEEDGLLGQSILRITGTALAVPCFLLCLLFQGLGRAFLKARGVKRQSLLARSAEREIFFFGFSFCQAFSLGPVDSKEKANERIVHRARGTALRSYFLKTEQKNTLYQKSGTKS